MSSIAIQDLAALRTRTRSEKTLIAFEGKDRIPAVVSSANAGDHHQIHSLLMDLFRGPPLAEFHAQLEDPTYEPINRLIVRRGKQIVAHCRLIDRSVTFGPVHLALSELVDVATRTEFRGQGYATQLLLAAEERMEADGAQIGLLTTNSPEFYARRGWIEAVRRSHSKARARDILAQLSAEETQTASPSLLPTLTQVEPLSIRLWRHVELDALMKIYYQNVSSTYGRTLRSEPFWRWLITRRGFDRILVAIQGSSKMQLDESSSRIEGYAAMSGSRIVELMAIGDRADQVRKELLARACRDAIERDDEVVRFDAPADDQLHRLLLTAGGDFYSQDHSPTQVTMAKVFHTSGLLEMLRPILFDRAKATTKSIATEIGLRIGDESFCITLHPRSVKISKGRVPRSFLECEKPEFDRIVMGFADVAESIKEGRIHASTRVAGETARVLFPILPFWRPPLDDLPAAAAMGK